MRRGALAAALRRGEWTEGLHPDSPLVFEAMATVENEFEAFEYRLFEIRRQEAHFAGELHQLMEVSTRLQRGQCEARRAMVRAARAPVIEQPSEQQPEEQSQQQQPEQEPGAHPKARPRTRSRSARRHEGLFGRVPASRTIGRTDTDETEPVAAEFSCFENASASFELENPSENT